MPITYWRRRVPINGSINGLLHLSEDEYWEQIAGRRTREVFRKAAQQGWLCFYCWLPLEEDRKKIVREHCIPRSKGGKNGKNIVASCVGCDKHKATQTWPPVDYIRKKRQTTLGALGLKSAKQSRYWQEFYPNFGKCPDGEDLWAPQFGII